ncbi:MAG: 3-deoxy-7-phosphoheptulonate synthase class II [Propionibacteriales bacterium]|nr:3-deoxy-7-phosphoheptulonate synthase class II [Propionibacteriales bacterium]
MSIPTLDELKVLGAAQQPTWLHQAELDKAVATLRSMPPLVFAGECDDLKSSLAEVAAGRAFLLQGGDCAETFEQLTAENVRAKLQVLLQMAVVLTYAASVPIVKVGRIAGQYAKPRSSDIETRGDVTLPAYRGDAVNGYPFTPESRVHDPDRLVRMYHASAATLNLSRAFLQGGYADLRQMHAWNTDFVRTSPVGAKYERMTADIDRALDFMKAIGAESEQLHRVGFHSSHEALILEYEHALTRIDSRTNQPYDVSGHFLWVGERTRQLGGAHLELLSRVRNPIGVKLGPTATSDQAVAYADKLNPDNEPGRLTFITRMGAGKIRDVLPTLVEKVTAAGIEVAWVSDPMHGNGFETSTGYKTRRFDDVIDEVRGFFEVHHALGTWPGGLHVELTGGDVTECIGGGEDLDEAGLRHRYESVCDPRLNRTQSLELAFLVAEMLRVGRS